MDTAVANIYRASPISQGPAKGFVPALSEAYFRTELGAAFLGDSRELLKRVPNESVDVVVTSPPFALQRQKQYGNVSPEQYVEWFQPFKEEIFRILKPSGSFFLHIGTSWTKGYPTKTLYHYRLILDLCDRFHLAQEMFWFNPARLPSPAEWVTVRRIRLKDAVEYVWWLSKTPYPKADNRKVLRPYSDAMKDLLQNGYKPKLRPSGHDISGKFSRDHGGSIPPNLLEISNTDSNSHYLRRCRESNLPVHPARYPSALPDICLRLTTEEGDIALDPFAGSNVTGEVCQSLGRQWIAFELDENYLAGSVFRFEHLQTKLIMEEKLKAYLAARAG